MRRGVCHKHTTARTLAERPGSLPAPLCSSLQWPFPRYSAAHFARSITPHKTSNVELTLKTRGKESGAEQAKLKSKGGGGGRHLFENFRCNSSPPLKFFLRNWHSALRAPLDAHFALR